MNRNYFLIFLLLCFMQTGFREKETTWVALGDSITYLNDHLDETYLRVRKGYMTRVTDERPDIQYINKGYNGWTAVQVARKIEELGIPKADIYTVFLGTNDWWAGIPAGKLDDYKQNKGNGTISGAFRVILDKLKDLNPQAKIVLITPMKRSDFVYVDNFKNKAYGSYKPKKEQSLEDVVEAIKAIGDYEELRTIDLYHHPALRIENLVHFKYLKDPATGKYKEFQYAEYTEIPFDPENDRYPYPLEAIGMTFDGLHPSDAGNEVIAQEILNVLK